jgi:hypothetical protein
MAISQADPQMNNTKTEAPLQAIQFIPTSEAGAPGQDLPDSTNKHRSIIPPPQSARIVHRYIAGESIRQIAREERRDRQTVTKIVRSEEVTEYVRSMRERFYGLGETALGAVQRALEQGDARLAYEHLKDIGVVPDREMTNAVQREMQGPTSMSEDEAVEAEARKLAYIMINRARTFGQPLPHVDEIEPAHEEPQHD